jgi:hypothetical protein
MKPKKDELLLPLNELIDKYAPNIRAYFKQRPEIYALGLLNNFDVNDLVSAITPGNIRQDGLLNHLKQRV